MLEACPLACDKCAESERAREARALELLAAAPTSSTAHAHPSSARAACRDRHAQCAEWAERGECTRSAAQMRRACAHSCGLCGEESDQGAVASEPCVDLNAQCAGWAEVGECARNPRAMERSCPLSCGVCTDGVEMQQEERAEADPASAVAAVLCLDSRPDCAGWAAAGECARNRGVPRACPRSCGRCDGAGSKVLKAAAVAEEEPPKPSGAEAERQEALPARRLRARPRPTDATLADQLDSLQRRVGRAPVGGADATRPDAGRETVGVGEVKGDQGRSRETKGEQGIGGVGSAAGAAAGSMAPQLTATAGDGDEGEAEDREGAPAVEEKGQKGGGGDGDDGDDGDGDGGNDGDGGAGGAGGGQLARVGEAEGDQERSLEIKGDQGIDVGLLAESMAEGERAAHHGVGAGCVDETAHCAGWAATGECEANRRAMEVACAKACGFCAPADDGKVSGARGIAAAGGGGHATAGAVKLRSQRPCRDLQVWTSRSGDPCHGLWSCTSLRLSLHLSLRLSLRLSLHLSLRLGSCRGLGLR